MVSQNKYNLIVKETHEGLSKPKSLFKRYFGFMPAVIIFPVMLWALWGNLEALLLQTLELRPWLLLLSALLLICHFVISGLGWWLLLRFFGANLSPYQSVRISAVALLGRYVPGKIWTVAGKIYMAHTKGVSHNIAYISSVYEFVLFNLSGVIVFFLMEVTNPSAMVYLKSLFVLLFMVIMCWPGIITWFLNHTLRIVRQEPVKITLKRRQLFYMIFYYSAGWLITGLSFYLFVRGLIPGLLYTQLTGAFVLASIVGFAVLFAPAGLGVREGVIAGLLIISGVSTDVAVFVSLCSRVWSTGGEIFIVIPMYLIKGKKMLRDTGGAG